MVREGVLRSAGLATAALLGLAAVSGSPAAQAATPEELPGAHEVAPPASAPAVDASSIIGGPSSCPRPDAVWGELVTLVPPERLEARLRAVARGKTPLVEIVDLGVPYRIIAAGQVREYRDESRDCAYRARIAAVFVALAIDPAQLPAAAAARAAPAPRRRRRAAALARRAAVTARPPRSGRDDRGRPRPRRSRRAGRGRAALVGRARSSSVPRRA